MAVVEPAKLELLLKSANNCKSLKYVIKIGNTVTAEEKQVAKNVAASTTLMYFRGVEAMGRESPRDEMPAKPDDLMTVCYTSGTTGDPKGVMVTNKNFIAEIAGVFSTLPDDLKLEHGEVHLSFLPLAHIFEQLVITALMAVSAKIAFYRGDVRKLMDDISMVRPTVFPAVPRLLNRVYDKVISTLNSASPVPKMIFKVAYAQKKKLLQQGIIANDTIWDKLVFAKIQKRLGGRVKFIVSGAAAISTETLEFLRIAMGCEVLEGYGQTETAAAVAVTVVGDYSTDHGGHVGSVIPCSEIKLVDCPDLDYLSTDKPCPRGEIWVRGNNVFKGYYKMADKTKETITDDGWC